MAALTDFMENRVIDFLFRGQALGLANSTAAAGTGPSTWWVGLLTVLPTDSTPGTEATGGNYARVAISSTLANWAGTQGATTTDISSGTSGTTSNNNQIVFPAPTAAWGQILGLGLYDSASGGNLCMYAPLTAAKTVNSSDPAPAFPISSLTFQGDN